MSKKSNILKQLEPCKFKNLVNGGNLLMIVPSTIPDEDYYLEYVSLLSNENTFYLVPDSLRGLFPEIDEMKDISDGVYLMANGDIVK